MDTKTVYVRRDGTEVLQEQHKDFENRTQFNDKGMENGNFSITILNVTINDIGNYTCVVSSDTQIDLTKVIEVFEGKN